MRHSDGIADDDRRPAGGRRVALRRALAAGAALALTGCGAGPARRVVPTPPVTWGDPFGERFAVVIDPGHGGNDAGTRAANGLLEKDLTLDVARRLRTRLAALDGVDVTLTRERDVWLSRADRVAAVRTADPDLLLSLHFNDLPQRHIALVETYYASATNILDSRERRRRQRRENGDSRAPADRSTELDEPNDISFTRGSARFAALLQRRVFAAVERGNPNAVDAGVKRDTLFMLTRGLTSGALIELTCLSNPEEAERLTGERYRDRLADALVEAIREYRALSNIVAPV